MLGWDSCDPAVQVTHVHVGKSNKRTSFPHDGLTSFIWFLTDFYLGQLTPSPPPDHYRLNSCSSRPQTLGSAIYRSRLPLFIPLFTGDLYHYLNPKARFMPVARHVPSSHMSGFSLYVQFSTFKRPEQVFHSPQPVVQTQGRGCCQPSVNPLSADGFAHLALPIHSQLF